LSVDFERLAQPFRTGTRVSTSAVLPARRARLVIFGILIYRPDVVFPLARQNVFCGKHGGHHGVVLIVVFMHAIAAHQMKSWTGCVERFANRIHMLLIRVVIYRIRLGWRMTQPSTTSALAARLTC